jgi:signal transduction histidine kinase
MLKHSLKISIILFILALLAFIGSAISIDEKETVHRCKTDIERYLSQTQNIVNQYLKSDQDKVMLKALDAVPLAIDVFYRDSIVFWNHASEISKSEVESSFQLATIGDTIQKVIVKLDISAYNHLVLYRHNYILTQNVGNLDFNVGSHRLGIQVLESSSFPVFKKIGWVLSYFAFIFLGIFFTTQLKVENAKNVRILSFAALVFVLYKCLHVFYFDHYLVGELEIFDVQNIDSFFSPNLAHLLINVVAEIFLVLWLPIGLKYMKPLIGRSPKVVAIFAGSITFLLFYMFIQTIQGFVLHSSANLEIEALLEFNAISFLLIICFLFKCLVIFQCTQILYEWVNLGTLSNQTKFLYSGIGWIIGFILSLAIWPSPVPIWMFLVFVAAYTLVIDAYTENNDKKITYLIWWMVLFSGFLAVTLFYFGLEKDISERDAFLKSYYSEPNTRIVSEIESLQQRWITQDIFTKISTLEVNSKLDADDMYGYMIDSMGYFESDSFKVKIELFNKNTGTTLFKNHFADFYKLNLSYKNAKRIGKNVYFNPFENKYIVRFEIARTTPVNGSWYLFLTISDKKLKPVETEFSQKYGFAIFNKGNLVEKSETYSGNPDFETISKISETNIMGGYSFVVYNPSEQYRLISWKKVSGLIKPISLFSFIFTIGGFVILILSWLNTRFEFLPKNLDMKFGEKSSLKTKIQLSIIVLILFTFLIIGAITGIYFRNLIQAQQNIRHQEETLSVVNHIKTEIQDFSEDEYALSFLNSKLNNLSYIYDKSLSLYDSNGSLIGTTSKADVEIKIPYHFWKLSKTNPSQSINMGNFQSFNFIPMFLNNKSKPLGYLHVHKPSHYQSAANILDFLSTILNAYIFLFLIAGAIAITIAQSITQPLSILAEKLKKFKLGKSNELLEWQSNDEIGTLIGDYNNLTQELDKSAGLLAKTERDMAWREMAKQVAHEIKNPLTPMKLNIQYLEKTAKDNPERAHEMIPRVSAVLIEQIDNLSQIANEFSNFAAMPQATNEKVILNEVIETIHDLFRKRDDMDIHMIEPIDDLYVFADKNHLVRILNNLLKNAIQAIPESRRGKIEIELKKQQNDAVIRITDNGTGIPDHMKDKVFTPNFTTKNSGTGLGLAISANMIDSFNGKIYFETVPGVGTDFFVSIPLMRSDEHYINENRVTLD